MALPEADDELQTAYLAIGVENQDFSNLATYPALTLALDFLRSEAAANPQIEWYLVEARRVVPGS